MGFSPDHRGAAGAQRWPRNSFEKVGKTSGRDQRPCWSQIPVSDTSHEPNSYRDFTPRHGGLVGGPRPSRPTFIHNSGGLRLLFPCGKSRCFSVTDQSNALLLRSYGNAISDAHNRSETEPEAQPEMANGKALLQYRNPRSTIILPISSHDFTAMPERNEAPDTFRCDCGFHLRDQEYANPSLTPSSFASLRLCASHSSHPGTFDSSRPCFKSIQSRLRIFSRRDAKAQSYSEPV